MHQYVPDCAWCRLVKLVARGTFDRGKRAGRTRWMLVPEGTQRDLDISAQRCFVVRSKMTADTDDADDEVWDVEDPRRARRWTTGLTAGIWHDAINAPRVTASWCLTVWVHRATSRALENAQTARETLGPAHAIQSDEMSRVFTPAHVHQRNGRPPDAAAVSFNALSSRAAAHACGPRPIRNVNRVWIQRLRQSPAFYRTCRPARASRGRRARGSRPSSPFCSAV